MSLKDAITTIENLAAEPLFGGQKERLDEVLRILKVVQEAREGVTFGPKLKEALERWRDRLSIARGSMFAELSKDDRDELYQIFLALAGPQ